MSAPRLIRQLCRFSATEAAHGRFGYYLQAMQATIYHGPRDLRLETVPDPQIRDSSDAIVRIDRAAICGSDLWFYRGVTKPDTGAQTSCRHGGFFGSENGGQAAVVRVPYADGTLVKMPDAIAKDQRKHNASAALCDVMGTGDPSPVFDLTLPLDRVAEGYAARDERRAINVLLEVA